MEEILHHITVYSMGLLRRQEMGVGGHGQASLKYNSGSATGEPLALFVRRVSSLKLIDLA